MITVLISTNSRGTKWEAQFLANVKDNAPPDIDVLRFSSLTLEQELENNTNSVLVPTPIKLYFFITDSLAK
jgi:hypothetical protein